MQDAVNKERQAKGFKLPHTVIDANDELAIVELAKAGVPYAEIGKQFGICRQHAGHIAIKNGVKRNGKSE